MTVSKQAQRKFLKKEAKELNERMENVRSAMKTYANEKKLVATLSVELTELVLRRDDATFKLAALRE